jgi:hypothetical protein
MDFRKVFIILGLLASQLVFAADKPTIPLMEHWLKSLKFRSNLSISRLPFQEPYAPIRELSYALSWMEELPIFISNLAISYRPAHL